MNIKDFVLKEDEAFAERLWDYAKAKALEGDDEEFNRCVRDIQRLYTKKLEGYMK